MKINRILSLATLTLLLGCGNPLAKQHAEALKRLEKIDTIQLVQECKVLLEESKGKEAYSVPRENWPPSIQKIDPFMVRHSSHGFSVSIVIEKGMAGHEMGIQVIPSDTPIGDPPQNTWKKISPSVYWYAE